MKNEIKSPEQQQAALLLVGKMAAEFVVNWHIRPSGADVAFLAAAVPNARQVVSADSGGDYDIWDRTGTKLLETDVPLQRAVTIVVTDYKSHKINLIMTRLRGKDWSKHQRKNQDLLKRITAEVFDIAAERRRSEARAPGRPENN